MTDDIAIKVENLSKCYQIYDQPSDRLKQFLFRNRRQYYREFWAVKDVSFEVKKGETVGIVGRNGSGKSTLLQIICGTLNPTTGSVQTKGRVAALLELGSGFNPEFTGRENVYMNAAVLGLSQHEIDERFDEILAFSEIGDFIEQPLKTYSSGMVMRLAFSVAINVDPDVLVVDEALSVGDERFQRKCFSRIESIREKGSTILFVSHSGSQVVELCDRAILIDCGEKLTVGLPKRVVGNYQKLLYAYSDKCSAIREQIKLIDKQALKNNGLILDNTDVLEATNESIKESFDPNLKPTSTIEYESNGAFIELLGIFNLAGEQINNLIRGQTYLYRYSVCFTKPANNVRFGMLIKTTTGMELGGGASLSDRNLLHVESGSSFKVEFRFRCVLNQGVYFLNAGVMANVNGTETYLHRLIDVAMFRVLIDSDSYATGIVDFGCFPEIDLETAEG